MKNFLPKYFIKLVIILSVILGIASCRMPDSFGFYQPITMSLASPDGPAEYKAGWHEGCVSALSLKTFSNAFVYGKGKGPDMGSGVYQHDPIYQTGWGQAWFACSLHASTFTNSSSMAHGPLQ